MTITQALKKNAKIIAGIALALFLLFGGIFLYRYLREERQVAKIQKMGEEFAQLMVKGDPKEFFSAENMEKMERMREEAEKIPEERRQGMGQAMMKTFMGHMKEYSGLGSETEKQAFLDKDIDRMQTMIKEAMKAALSGGFGGRGFPGMGGPGGAGGGRGPGGGFGGNRVGGTQAAGEAGNGQQAGQGGGFGPMGGFSNRSPEDRMNRMMTMFDMVSAQDRQQMAEYMGAMQSRLKERGVPQMLMGPFGGGPGRGGPGGRPRFGPF